MMSMRIPMFMLTMVGASAVVERMQRHDEGGAAASPFLHLLFFFLIITTILITERSGLGNKRANGFVAVLIIAFVISFDLLTA